MSRTRLIGRREHVDRIFEVAAEVAERLLGPALAGTIGDRQWIAARQGRRPL